MSLVMMTVVMIIIVLTRPPGDSDLYSPCKHIMMTKPKLARMGGQEEMNGNDLNIAIGADLAPMMRMVVVMMVMKLVH